MKDNLTYRERRVIDKMTSMRNGREIGKHLRKIKTITPAIAEYAVSRYSYHLYLIPEECRTEAVCQAALKMPAGLVFKYIPEHLLTDQMILDAVRKNYCALAGLEEEERTLERVKAGLDHDIRALYYCNIRPIPFSLSEEQMRRLISFPDMLSMLSNEVITPAICEAVLRANSLRIDCVPKHLLTDEMIMQFMQNHPDSMHLIPEDRIDIQCWVKVFLANIEALKHYQPSSDNLLMPESHLAAWCQVVKHLSLTQQLNGSRKKLVMEHLYRPLREQLREETEALSPNIQDCLSYLIELAQVSAIPVKSLEKQLIKRMQSSFKNKPKLLAAKEFVI